MQRRTPWFGGSKMLNNENWWKYICYQVKKKHLIRNMLLMTKYVHNEP